MRGAGRERHDTAHKWSVAERDAFLLREFPHSLRQRRITIERAPTEKTCLDPSRFNEGMRDGAERFGADPDGR